MARKFKRKLAAKPKLEKKVLAIEIIGKEYFKKVKEFVKRISGFAKDELTKEE